MNPSIEHFLAFFWTGPGFALGLAFVLVTVAIFWKLRVWPDVRVTPIVDEHRRADALSPFMVRSFSEPAAKGVRADASRSRELASVVSMTDRRIH